MFQSLAPVVAVSQFSRRLLHLVFAPGVLFLPYFDQLFWGVGNSLRRQVRHQAFATDRLANNRVFIARLDANKLFANHWCEFVQRFVDPGIRFGNPPSEHRIVALEEAKPFGKVGL